MSVLSTNSVSVAPEFGGLLNVVAAKWTALKAAVKAELEIQQAIYELRSMSDRDLDDMNIARHEIAARVRGN